MISPPHRDRIRCLEAECNARTVEMRNRLERASGAMKVDTLVGAIREHPVVAVAAAVGGGIVASRLMSFSGMGGLTRLVVMPLVRSFFDPESVPVDEKPPLEENPGL